MVVDGVYVSGVTTDQVGCTDADYDIGGASASGITVPAGTDVGAWSGLTVAFLNRSVNQDACKNAAVTISYTTTDPT